MIPAMSEVIGFCKRKIQVGESEKDDGGRGRGEGEGEEKEKEGGEISKQSIAWTN